MIFTQRVFHPTKSVNVNSLKAFYIAHLEVFRATLSERSLFHDQDSFIQIFRNSNISPSVKKCHKSENFKKINMIKENMNNEYKVFKIEQS